MLEFNHEPGRFFQTDAHDQLLAQLTYTILAADIVSIDQVFVAPAYRGQQIATQLVSTFVNWARPHHYQIVPVCPFAHKMFEQDSTFQKLWYHPVSKGAQKKMKQDQLKQAVGIKSVDFIQDHMTVGLGTGSTVYYMVEELGKRVQAGDLTVNCVSTSQRTWDQAKKLGINMLPLDQVDHIDLTIDGADEIDTQFQGVKGGGAALTYEKIVALNSQRNLWIVDQSKQVQQLGAFGIPLEVIPFGHQQLLQRLEAENLHPQWRMDDHGQPVLTDMHNYIFDLHLDQLQHPHLLADWLDHQTGIIEHGLFLDIVNTVIVGTANGPQIIENIR